MWPWEHVIVGYLAYSLLCHLFYRDSPDGLETIAVVAGALLPDLIDKPLAWEFGVFGSGYALGHSAFAALPLSLTAGLVARRLGRARAGIALALGYLLHLPGDVLYGFVHDGVLYVDILLWPFRRGAGYGQAPGFQEQVVYFLERYREELAIGDLSTYLLVQLGLASLVVTLWLYDGAPIIRECVSTGRRLGHRIRAAM